LLCEPARMQIAHTLSALPAATNRLNTFCEPPIVKPITPSICLNWSKLDVCRVIAPKVTWTGPRPARLTWSLWRRPEMVHGAVGALRSHVWYVLEKMNGNAAELVEDVLGSYA